MLRNMLIASSLLIASSSALANHGYVTERIVRVEPNFSISLHGESYHDGYRVPYESEGRRHWTHSPYHPGKVIYVAHPVYENGYGDSGYRRGRHHHHHRHHHHKRHDHHRYGHGHHGHRGHH